MAIWTFEVPWSAPKSDGVTRKSPMVWRTKVWWCDAPSPMVCVWSLKSNRLWETPFWINMTSQMLHFSCTIRLLHPYWSLTIGLWRDIGIYRHARIKCPDKRGPPVKSGPVLITRRLCALCAICILISEIM